MDNNVTYEQYYNTVKDIIRIEEYSYSSTDIDGVNIKVWNMDHSKNKAIKVTRKANNFLSLK